jgi:two-component system, LytTR family, sensor kinase
MVHPSTNRNELRTMAVTKKYTVPVIHAFAWVSILFIPFYIVHVFGDGNNSGLKHFYVNAFIFGSIFYINYLFLAPRFYVLGKKWRYFLAAIVLTGLMYLLQWYINDVLLFDADKAKEMAEGWRAFNKGKNVPPPPVKEFKLFMFFLGSILISGFALGLNVIRQLAENEKQRKELEKEKLNSELAMLKNQLSPHFFFNTLNNIYSLIEIDGVRAQEAVLKLSKMMRYMLYESEHQKAPMAHELAFMESYVALMRLRLSAKVDFQVSFPKDCPAIDVPPLLFVSFIENAFKHGISHREQSFIHIVLVADENHLNFTCINSIHALTEAGADMAYGGIGLENVKKRLALLYPSKHHLEIEQTDHRYSVNLEIKL